MTSPIATLLREKRVLVLCGAGGVGKTTTSAALALAAAAAGRRTLVLTIDPARRLAQALGIPPNSAHPTRVPVEKLVAAGLPPTTQLDAWMLDPRVMLDRLVTRFSSPESAALILENKMYRHMQDLMAGVQEYTAGQALYEFSHAGTYDLVVLDTPPSRNALDFLDAPGRLGRFLEEGIVQMFMPSQGGLLRRAGRFLGGIFGRVFGDSFVGDMQAFVGAFGGLFSTMSNQAEGVRLLLSSPESAFVLVTSTETAAIGEAMFFRDQIQARELPFAGFVLNRSFARALEQPHPSVLDSAGLSPAVAASFAKLADVERARATLDAALLGRLEGLAGKGRFALAAPHLGEAVEDVAGLVDLGRGLGA